MNNRDNTPAQSDFGQWRKSHYSHDIGACVEARDHAEGTDVRDTENRTAGHLTFTRPEWAALRAAL